MVSTDSLLPRLSFCHKGIKRHCGSTHHTHLALCSAAFLLRLEPTQVKVVSQHSGASNMVKHCLQWNVPHIHCLQSCRPQHGCLTTTAPCKAAQSPGQEMRQESLAAGHAGQCGWGCVPVCPYPGVSVCHCCLFLAQEQVARQHDAICAVSLLPTVRHSSLITSCLRGFHHSW